MNPNANQRYRNGDRWNQRAPPGLQEDKDDENDQDDRFCERLHDLADGFFDHIRGVERDLVFHTGRELRR